ncbi:DMT family transporter [Paenibacillus arenilitoris]|uniref:DMT family transporter n=1 Tax=Paenibacillus arenilitoris TaxID=2772299 RepID=A0A927CKH4_9BACL|nr:DMT family transporter [Paenibacillus arenilitoris]MBD2869214.1 DMT family transporter [Paenibacillus arenilitoris]
MIGILYSLLAGLVISVQSVFNARMTEKTGFWFTNAWVHGTGFAITLIILLLLKDDGLARLPAVNKLYWLGGAMGVMIVFSVTKGITSLGPAYSVALLLIMQLLVAMVIDSLGLFGVDRVPVTPNKLIGIAVMIAGVIVFKLK